MGLPLGLGGITPQTRPLVVQCKIKFKMVRFFQLVFGPSSAVKLQFYFFILRLHWGKCQHLEGGRKSRRKTKSAFGQQKVRPDQNVEEDKPALEIQLYIEIQVDGLTLSISGSPI